MAKLELNEKQKQALEQALLQLKDDTNILKNNDKINTFVTERMTINSESAKKHPVVKEYLDLYKEAEKQSYTNIGRMARDMKNVALEQESLKLAATLCEDAKDKVELMQAAKDLDNHPAMLAYNKYLKGLRYLAGLEETFDKETDEFFEEDLRVPLEAGKDYNKWRKNKVVPATKESAKANQQFQKLAAPAKARELFSKNCSLSHHGICKQFLGVRILTGVKGVFRERMTPTLFCVAQMAKQGYSIDEITNPKLFIEEKKKIGAEYLKRRNSNTKEDEKWYIEEMYYGAEAMIKAYHQYAKGHKNEIKTELDLALHGSELGVFSHLCYDMLQELDYLKDHVHKEFKTPQEFYDMAFKVGGYTYGEGTGTTDKLLYDLEDMKDPILCANEIQRQLYIKAFLDELQKDDPNLETLTATPEQINAVRDQISTMPEFQSLFVPVDPDELDGERELDTENLTNKQLKVLASMVSQRFLNDNNISVVVPKVPVTVTSDPLKGSGLIIKEGAKIDRVVTRDDKQVIETDLPGKMSTYLHALEKNGLKGKAKDNSDEFNKLVNNYEKTLRTLDKTSAPNKECLDEMKKLKEAAAEYIKAKREQKGYGSKSVPDATIDAQMLGKTKGKASIFTSRGKNRYEFALNLIKRVTILENKLNGIEKEENQIQEKQNKTIEKHEKNKSKKPDAIDKEIETTELGGFGI